MNISAVLIIIVITCIVSVIGFQNRDFFNAYKHHPYSENKYKQYYRMLTSGFLHGDFMHLGINMFVLWEFGKLVERIFTQKYGGIGSFIFVAFYLVMIVIADLPTSRKHINNPGYAAIGASGAVSGILFSFILFNPWSKLYLYFAIPIPAIIFGVLYIGYSSWADQKNKNDGIGHSAHLYGALAGIILTLILIPESGPHFLERITNF